MNGQMRKPGLAFLVSLLAMGFLPVMIKADGFRRIRTEQSTTSGVTLEILRNPMGQIQIRAHNPDRAVYNISLGISHNMNASKSLPLRQTLEPQSSSPLLLLSPAKGKKTEFKNLQWRIHPGPASNARINHVGLYRFPWAVGQSYLLTRGLGGDRQHPYAMDFRMPVGTAIHAARKGVVIGIENRFAAAPEKADATRRTNFIIVLHEDGSMGRYLHLKRDGVTVKLNEEVQAGQLIGFSGNSGLSREPHLHFDVMVPDARKGIRAVPFQFVNLDGIVVSPQYGEEAHHRMAPR